MFKRILAHTLLVALVWLQLGVWERPTSAQTVVPAARTVAAAAKTGAGDEARRRREAFEIVWQAVRDYHFDPSFGGVDWDAVKREFGPRVEAAHSDRELHWLLQQMLNRLGQSHFSIVPPESIPALPEEGDGGEGEDAGDGAAGARGKKVPSKEALDLTARLTHGLRIDLRIVGGAAVVTRVEPNSEAWSTGLRTGFIIRSVDGVPVRRILRRLEQAAVFEPAVRIEMPAELLFEYFNGAPGTSVRVGYLDARNRPRRVVVRRERLQGEMAPAVQSFPAQFVEFESRRLQDGIGYIRFNVFAAPVLDKFCAALRGMTDAPGLILDLRGNRGGVLALIYGIGGLLATHDTVFGEMRTRAGGALFRIVSQRHPYNGPLAVLVDRTSASASEILASGLQESGRAVVIGERSAGSTLPSVAKELPTGAILQYAFADFLTPYGKVLEGQGVEPDISVKLDRRSLLRGRDPQLEAAVAAVQEAAVAAPAHPPVELSRSAEGEEAWEGGEKAEGPAQIEPEAAAVIERYLKAVGGRAALEGLTSRVSRGTFIGSYMGVAATGTVEVFEQTPEKFVFALEVSGTLSVRRGYTGTHGYEQVSLFGLREIKGAELAAMKASSDFRWSLDLARFYAKVTLKGREKVGDAEAYLVEATPARGPASLLYFDAQTGLLLRRDGVDFEDYREVDGVKLPFVQRSPGGTITLKDVRHNVAISDAQFAERQDCFTR